MSENVPPLVPKAFRIALTLDRNESRMDSILLQALRDQDENLTLKVISRGALKDLFTNKRIMIKGQRAKANSSLAKGVTYIDILGY